MQQPAGLQRGFGGQVYEMAIRDHFRVDVLARDAARTHTARVKLGEVERLHHRSETGVPASCPLVTRPAAGDHGPSSAA